VQPRPAGQVQLHVQDGPLDADGDRGGVRWIGGEAAIGNRVDQIIPKLLDIENRECGGHYQIPFVVHLVASCSGASQLCSGEVCAGQQLGQRQQRPRLAGPFLTVDLLEAGDVGPEPEDLRPHERDPLGQRRPFTRSGLIKILEIECSNPDLGHRVLLPRSRCACARTSIWEDDQRQCGELLVSCLRLKQRCQLSLASARHARSSSTRSTVQRSFASCLGPEDSCRNQGCGLT
jgi:hypothetical protein